jgi:hypothetical protein
MDNLYELSVAIDTGGIGLISIPLQDIIFIEYIRQKKGIIVHSLEADGFLPGSFDFWLSALQGAGLTTLFPVDRNNALNLAKIEILDAKHKVAYFENSRRKGCTIAVANFKAVMNELDGLNRSYKIV